MDSLSSVARANLRPFGAPPSRGRRENTASQTPHEEDLRHEYAASPHSSFRAKARNLFRSRSGEPVRSAGNGKHRISCDLGARKENSHFPIGKPSPPHRRFERKREIFFPERFSSYYIFPQKNPVKILAMDPPLCYNTSNAGMARLF